MYNSRTIILKSMELKSGNKYLEQVRREVHNLSFNIQSALYDRTDTNNALEDRDIDGLLKAIRGKLENVPTSQLSVLEDKISLYNYALEELKQIIFVQRFDENDLSSSEIESFKKVKEALQISKDENAGLQNKVLEELKKRNEKGELGQEYRIQEQQKVEIKQKDVENELKDKYNPIVKFVMDIEPEMDQFDKDYSSYGEIIASSNRLLQYENDLKQTGIEDWEKDEITENIIKERNKIFQIVIDDEYMEEDYYTKDSETDDQSFKRVYPLIVKQYEDNMKKYKSTVENKLDDSIKVYDSTNKTFEQVEIKDRYFTGKNLNKLSFADLADFNRKLIGDQEVVQQEMAKELKEKQELQQKKQNYINDSSDPNKKLVYKQEADMTVYKPTRFPKLKKLWNNTLGKIFNKQYELEVETTKKVDFTKEALLKMTVDSTKDWKKGMTVEEKEKETVSTVRRNILKDFKEKDENDGSR